RGPQVQDEYESRYDCAAADGPRHATVQGDEAEPTLGRRPDVRRDVARVRVCGVCDRCVLAADRRLASVELAAQRPGARCIGAGALRAANWRVRAARAP